MCRISEHFKREEFACKCGCGFDVVDAVTHRILVEIRSHFVDKYPERKVFITINSGCRCLHHNEMVGGSEFSYHVDGMAADIVVNEVEPKEVYDYLCRAYSNEYGFILYRDKGFVHVDCRQDCYRKIR
jgi:uncharacterized protein YcbK (DUF882 family)